MDKLEDQIATYLKRLFPLTRSLTGDGNRESLKILKEIIPLNTVEYSSGEKVFDWTIPQEWIIRDAWIKNSKGRKLVDFHKSNIHVLGYSKPIHRKMQLKEFKNHLYYLEDIPEAIPYRTSYYNDN